MTFHEFIYPLDGFIFKARVGVEMFKERGVWIAECPSLGLSGYDQDKKMAMDSLEVVIAEAMWAVRDRGLSLSEEYARLGDGEYMQFIEE